MSPTSRALDFYERGLGWRRNERINYSTYAELLAPNGGALGLFERDGFVDIVGAAPVDVPEGRVAPGYLYARVDDAHAVAARFEAAGGRLLSPLADRSWGEAAAWFADPDGNVVAVAQSIVVDESPSSAGIGTRS